MTLPSAERSRHVDALDGLRGVAILLVLLHGFDVVSGAHGLGHLIDSAFDAGWIGVQLFFVLSGFLITGILLDTRDSPDYYRNFFVRRVLRIFPLYYGVLFVAFVLLPLFMDIRGGADQVWLWTYLANFAAPFGHGESAFPHFWSLCVEEQFYLVWPLIVRHAGRRGVIAISIVLTLLAVASRIFLRIHFGEPVGHEAAYLFTPARMDALALGALAGALLREPRVAAWMERRQPTTWFGSGVAVVAAGLVIGRLQRTGDSMQVAGYTLLGFGFALILLSALREDGLPARWLRLSLLRRCGLYSYAMYVFYAPLHLFVGLPLIARFGGDGGLRTGMVYQTFAMSATFLIAAASYHFYERRFLALKPRLAPPVTA